MVRETIALKLRIDNVTDVRYMMVIGECTPYCSAKATKRPG
jgi:hypothetical protein